MWMTIYNALSDEGPPDADAPPAHCPHPSACQRLPLEERRSFARASTTRSLLLDRYRRMLFRQCACNGARKVDVRT